MKKNTDKERRYPRIKSESIISVRPLSERGSGETVTTSKVLGLGGVMFESARRMRAGQRLELSLLAGAELLKFPVQVVWCRKAGTGTWQVGVEFREIAEAMQEKLLDFLMRRVYLEEEIKE